MDPITDLIIGGVVALVGTAEDIIPTVAGFANAMADFLGPAGVDAVFDGVEALGNLNLSEIGPQLTFDGGIITHIELPTILSAADTTKLINSLNILVRLLAQKGIDATTESGKAILYALFQKVKDYGPGLTASALGTYVGGQISNYAANRVDRVTDNIKDRVADRIGNILP